MKFIKAGGCKNFFYNDTQMLTEVGQYRCKDGKRKLNPDSYEQRTAFLLWSTFLSSRMSSVCFLTKMIERPIFPADAYDRAADLQIVAHRKFAKSD